MLKLQGLLQSKAGYHENTQAQVVTVITLSIITNFKGDFGKPAGFFSYSSIDCQCG